MQLPASLQAELASRPQEAPPHSCLDVGVERGRRGASRVCDGQGGSGVCQGATHALVHHRSVQSIDRGDGVVAGGLQAGGGRTWLPGDVGAACETYAAAMQSQGRYTAHFKEGRTTAPLTKPVRPPTAVSPGSMSFWSTCMGGGSAGHTAGRAGRMPGAQVLGPAKGRASWRHPGGADRGRPPPWARRSHPDDAEHRASQHAGGGEQGQNLEPAGAPAGQQPAGLLALQHPQVGGATMHEPQVNFTV